MNKAKFTVTCEEAMFSRSMEIPVDARGHVHALAEDLAKSMDFYRLKIENHKLKQTLLAIKAIPNDSSKIIEDLEKTIYLELT